MGMSISHNFIILVTLFNLLERYFSAQYSSMADEDQDGADLGNGLYALVMEWNDPTKHNIFKWIVGSTDNVKKRLQRHDLYNLRRLQRNPMTESVYDDVVSIRRKFWDAQTSPDPDIGPIPMLEDGNETFQALNVMENTLFDHQDVEIRNLEPFWTMVREYQTLAKNLRELRRQPILWNSRKASLTRVHDTHVSGTSLTHRMLGGLLDERINGQHRNMIIDELLELLDEVRHDMFKHLVEQNEEEAQQRQVRAAGDDGDNADEVFVPNLRDEIEKYDLRRAFVIDNQTEGAMKEYISVMELSWRLRNTITTICALEWKGTWDEHMKTNNAFKPLISVPGMQLPEGLDDISVRFPLRLSFWHMFGSNPTVNLRVGDVQYPYTDKPSYVLVDGANIGQITIGDRPIVGQINDGETELRERMIREMARYTGVEDVERYIPRHVDSIEDQSAFWERVSEQIKTDHEAARREVIERRRQEGEGDQEGGGRGQEEEEDTGTPQPAAGNDGGEGGGAAAGNDGDEGGGAAAAAAAAAGAGAPPTQETPHNQDGRGEEGREEGEQGGEAAESIPDDNNNNGIGVIVTEYTDGEAKTELVEDDTKKDDETSPATSAVEGTDAPTAVNTGAGGNDVVPAAGAPPAEEGSDDDVPAADSVWSPLLRAIENANSKIGQHGWSTARMNMKKRWTEIWEQKKSKSNADNIWKDLNNNLSFDQIKIKRPEIKRVGGDDALDVVEKILNVIKKRQSHVIAQSESKPPGAPLDLSWEYDYEEEDDDEEEDNESQSSDEQRTEQLLSEVDELLRDDYQPQQRRHHEDEEEEDTDPVRELQRQLLYPSSSFGLGRH